MKKRGKIHIAVQNCSKTLYPLSVRKKKKTRLSDYIKYCYVLNERQLNVLLLCVVMKEREKPKRE